ncbi:aspartyl protease family protein At5g10770-like [Malania oleifera]|uniref:aspartyl protease family protein At5g10770-like n=1 Tax=Malania oleifera TaxID=397392 RepID=UPI0025AE6163|nr:aspartyl protease family protein At5g10770-like [Malania oleifera]
MTTSGVGDDYGDVSDDVLLVRRVSGVGDDGAANGEWLCDSAVLSSITLMLFAYIVWLKLVSYAHTSYNMRALAKLAHELSIWGSGYLFLIVTLLIFYTIISHNYTHILSIGFDASDGFDSLIVNFTCPAYNHRLETVASLKVVHKDGPCFQPSKGQVNTPTRTLAQKLIQDQYRVDSIHSRATLPVKSGLILMDTYQYVATIGLGTPVKNLTLILDTGSDLTWTQCKPCFWTCYNQSESIFDPSKSSSYSNIMCSSTMCTQLTGNPPNFCTINNTCIYTARYADQSFTQGFIAKDKLSLTQSNVVEDFIFGCGQDNEGNFGGTAGIFGLGPGDTSIMAQTAQKYKNVFSYCLPSLPSLLGHLTFGSTNILSHSIKFTPFVEGPQYSDHYFLELLAISVGGEKLPINSSTFSTAGTIIDSGTIITRLPSSAYAQLRLAFQQRMKGYPMAQAWDVLDTCYDFSNYKHVMIPKISLFFSGNVELGVDSSGILVAENITQVCLAFIGNADANYHSIIGSYQQKTVDVIYDLAGKRLGLRAYGCH